MPDKRGKSGEISQQNEDRKFLLDTLTTIKEEISSNINDKFNKVENQLQSMIENITLVNNKIANIESVQIALKEQCTTLEQAREAISDDVRGLSYQQRDLEQHSRCSNLEITGLPLTQNENVYAILQSIANTLKVEHKKEDISIAHRLKLFSKKHKYPPLIVQFVSRTVRENWLSAARHHKNLMSTNIHTSLEPSMVFINEHLTPHNKALLGRARRLLREKKLIFAGYFNGKVLIKKTEADAVVRVLELFDLDKYE